MGGCSAPNCTNSSRKGFRIFKFPKDPVRKKQWIVNCNREGLHFVKNASLCEVHFEPDQFENRRMDGWKKLRPYAVPTLFSYSTMEKPYIYKSVVKMVNIVKTLKDSFDHTYSEYMAEEEEENIESMAPSNFNFSNDDQDEEMEQPTEETEMKRPEIIVLKPADVEPEHLIISPDVSVPEDSDEHSFMEPSEEECASVVCGELPDNSVAESSESRFHQISPSSIVPKTVSIYSLNDQDTVFNVYESIFHDMADFIKENRPDFATLSATRVLMYACGQFGLPVQFLSKVYSGEHFAGRGEIHSCTVMIKDVMVAEDVSRDMEEANSRAARLAYDTILSHSFHIEINEFGVMRLKRVQRDTDFILPTSSLEEQAKENQVSNQPRNNKNPAVSLVQRKLAKENVVGNRTKSKKKKKKKPRKVFMQNFIALADQNNELAFEQAIRRSKNCDPCNPLDEGRIIFLAEDVDAVPVGPHPKFVIYDNSEVTNVQCDCAMLKLSAALSSVELDFKHRMNNLDRTAPVVCEIYMRGYLMCKAIASSKEAATRCASSGVIKALTKIFYTIKEKIVESDDFKITLNHIKSGLNPDISKLLEENNGCKLLKSRGWDGGGIRKMGNGITEPPRTDDSYGQGRGLGFSDQRTFEHHFSAQVDTILSDYAVLNPACDLIFTSEFSATQFKKIEQKAEKRNMKSLSRVVQGKGKELVISRKYSIQELFNMLKNSGSTDKYKLISPNEPFENL